jgi:hypothetical protein
MLFFGLDRGIQSTAHKVRYRFAERHSAQFRLLCDNLEYIIIYAQ